MVRRAGGGESREVGRRPGGAWTWIGGGEERQRKHRKSSQACTHKSEPELRASLLEENNSGYSALFGLGRWVASWSWVFLFGNE